MKPAAPVTRIFIYGTNLSRITSNLNKQLNILRKNHKNIQKADFVARLRCRCRVVVLHFLKRIMAAKRHKKTQKREGDRGGGRKTERLRF